ncbi:hypothetical protein ACM66B_006928 [Microbotryomycetes sp. NB124-2]
MKRLFNKKDKSSSANSSSDVSSASTGQPQQQQQQLTNGGTSVNASAQHPISQPYMGPGAPQVPQGYVLMHAPVLVPVVPGHMRPPPPQQVSNAIGWSCASSTFDFPYILSLADHLSSSSAASKEAAKALRKEFKHATPEAQERAVRLTGILMRNTDLRFREQVASKKFLAELSDLHSNKKTDPRVKDMIVRVLSPLAFEYQRDAELNPITTLYNKIKSPEAPINGLPLDPDDPLLQPTLDPRTSGNTQGRRRAPQRLPSQSEQLSDLRRQAEQARGDARLLSDALSYAKPDDDVKQNEIVQEFHLKCFEAQEFLSNNLHWATVQAERSRAAVDEAGTKDNIPVDQAEQIRRVDATVPRSESARLSSNNPFAPIASGERPMPPTSARPARETPEEATLAVLLAAHSEVLEALQAYDRHAQNYAEMRDVRAAEERSKVDTKFDRSRAGMPDQNGDYQESTQPDGDRDPFEDGEEAHEQGGSRGPTSLPRQVVQTSPAPAQRSTTTSPPPSRNPYAAYLSPTPTGQTQTSAAPSTTTQEYGVYVIPESFDAHRQPSATLLDGRRPETLSISTTTNGSASGLAQQQQEYRPLVDSPVSPYGALGRSRRDTSDSASEGLQTPVVPSEKALGKLRRVSIREDSDTTQYEDQQAKLEQALREKYAKNYNEHHGHSQS